MVRPEALSRKRQAPDPEPATHYARGMTDTQVLPEPTPTTPKKKGRGRSIAAVFVFLLAVALTPIALISYWAQSTVTDTGRYLETVQPLASDPDVQQAVATFVTEKIEEQIDTEALVQEIFGGLIDQAPALQALVPVVSGAIDSLIGQVVERLVTSDAFVGLWDTANESLQKGLMAILEGRDDGAVSLQGDAVVLDISSVIDEVKQGLVDKGFTAAANINIPVKSQQVVLFEAPQLAALRTLYSFTKPLMTWLIVAAVVLFILAIVLAHRRPRMVAWTGGAILVIGALLIVALQIGQGAFIASLANTPFENASLTFYETLLRFLYEAAAVTLILGLILFIVGLYLCGAAWAVQLRGGVNRVADKVGGSVPVGPLTRSGAWVAAHARWVRVAIAALFAVIVFWGANVNTTRTLVAALIALVLLVIVQVWAASATVERPKDTATATA